MKQRNFIGRPVGRKRNQKGWTCRVAFKIGKACAIKVGMDQKMGQWSRTMGLAFGFGG